MGMDKSGIFSVLSRFMFQRDFSSVKLYKMTSCIKRGIFENCQLVSTFGKFFKYQIVI